MSGILVTGATGTVGGAVVRHLLEAGAPVVAGVRDPNRSSLPGAVEPRRLDLAAAVDPRVFDGVDRMFLMRPPAVADVASTLVPLIDVALAAGVRRIVFLSLQGVQANRRTPHHAVEAHLRRTGADYTFLRPNFFMQNLSTVYRDEIRETGEIALPAGRSHTAFIDTDDIGLVAATTLTRAGHERRAYTLSGEQSLTYRQVAEILTGVLGRPIRYLPLTPAEHAGRLRAAGAAADYIDVQRMIYRIVRWNVSALPNRAVRRITGRPATDFRTFAERERAVWMPPAAT